MLKLTHSSSYQIKVKSDAAAVSFYEQGLEFADGTKVEADVVVFATGFLGNLRNHVEQIFGKDIADRGGDCFGLNEEGEILGAFKPVPRKSLPNRLNLLLAASLASR